MEIFCKRQYGNLVVELAGELDSSQTRRARSQIEEAYERTHARDLIFDFSRLTFMDSSAIGLVVGRCKLVHSLGGRVFLTGIDQRTDRMFAAAGLYRLAEKREEPPRAGQAGSQRK